MRAYYRDWWRLVRAQVGAELRTHVIVVIGAVIVALAAPPVARIILGASAAAAFSTGLVSNLVLSVLLLLAIAVVLFVPAAIQVPATMRAADAATIAALRADLGVHAERLKPKLRLHFAGRVPPCYAEIPVVQDWVSHYVRGKARLFRVGIANESTAAVDGVEVILQTCSLTDQTNVYLTERLGISGRGATVSVPPGQPVMFADMVQQDAWDGDEPRPAHFCYVNEGLRGELDRHGFTFSVVVLGGGSRDEASFNLMYGSDGTIAVVENPRPIST